MLVIMHNWDVRCFCNSTFDFKAFWGLDVFKVNTSKSLRNIDNGLNKFFRIGNIDFNVKNIDISEGFEQQSLTLHDRFTCKCTNVSKTQNGRSVGNHGYEIPFRCVPICILWSFCDFQTRICYTWRIGKRKFVSRCMWLGWYDFDFPLR